MICPCKYLLCSSPDKEIALFSLKSIRKASGNCSIAGREGSNHPARGNARRVLEYIDNTHNIYFQVRDEIFSTKEELLKDFEHYRRQIPAAQMATGHVDLGQS